MDHRLSRRTGITMGASLLAAAAISRVTAQSATPNATGMTSIPDLPQGPLGEQIQWLVDLLNGDLTAITADAVEPHFSDNALIAMSANDLATLLSDLSAQMAPITVEPGTMVTTRDLPPTTARFVITSGRGDRLQVNLGVSSATGLIETLGFSTVPQAVASPVASPVASIPDLPQGPLGEQIQWLVNLMNGDPQAITGQTVSPHLAPIVLAEVSADDLADIVADVASQVAPVMIEPETLVTTRDLPPTASQFVLIGRDNTRLLVTLSVDGESGLVTGLYFQPAADPGTSAATPAS